MRNFKKLLRTTQTHQLFSAHVQYYAPCPQPTYSSSSNRLSRTINKSPSLMAGILARQKYKYRAWKVEWDRGEKGKGRVSLTLTTPFTFCVPRTGIEPALPCDNQILSLARLPIPPSGLFRMQRQTTDGRTAYCFCLLPLFYRGDANLSILSLMRNRYFLRKY